MMENIAPHSWRFSGVSYALLLSGSHLAFAGHTGRLLRAVLGTSILFLLAHLVFQICLYTVPNLDQLLGSNCSTWETLAQHIGVTRLDLNDIPNSVRLVAPDLGILLVSAICLGICSRLQPVREIITWRTDALAPGSPRRRAQLAARLRVKAHGLLMAVGKILAVVLIALAGITLPSAFSSVYYLLFVGLMTWWACHFSTSQLAFNALCIMVDVFAGGHLICLYGYQTPFMQETLPPTGLWARLFGLKAIVLPVGCNQPNKLLLDVNHPWPVYANPGILLLLYYVLATLVKLRRLHFSEQVSPECLCVTFGTLEDKDHLPEDAKVRRRGFGSRSLQKRKPPQEKMQLLHSLGHVVLKQSYVCALIAMMVWSITYHSWLTFVLLLWACLIWIVRNRHHFAMLCSPFILLYGIALCSLQYVWGMDLEPELPTKVGFMPLEQLGLVRPPYPCLDLGAKLLYTLTFWLLVRQFVKEKLLKKKPLPDPLMEVMVIEAARPQARCPESRGQLCEGLYAKFWILVCAGMFIVVSFAGRLVVYKIVYMFLFLLFLTLFQVISLKLLKAFWWFVVAYTMLVLIAVYTFQFEDFPMYWRNFTHLTDEQLGDLGLEQFSVSELFSSIFIPGFFLLACILQLHYFHQPFMHITDLECVISPGKGEISGRQELLQAEGGKGEDPEISLDEYYPILPPPPPPPPPPAEGVPSKWGLVLQRLSVLGKSFSDILGCIQVFVLRLLELHILKLVALYIMWVALQEVSVMNLLLVVLWAFAVPYSRFCHMASCLSTIWACIIIVCKMLYQLKIVNPQDYDKNCSLPLLNETNLHPEEIGNSTLYQGPVDPANWFGIRKQYPNLGYIQNHLQVLVLLVFEAVVYRCQEYYRKKHQLVPPLTQTVFEDATRQNLDRGLLNCVKYFINYFFYKFGLEICFLVTVNVIGQRMNFMVIFHGCWLVVILTRRRRQAIAKLWPTYCLFLALFIIFQYLLCVGIPPVLCIDYPWRWSPTLPITSVLIKWMYFPDFFMKPNSINLMSDFLLLLCVSQQWKVFVNEQTEDWVQLAGDNREQLEPLQGQPNPVPNFVNCRSYLDMAKVCVFRYLFWFVLVIIFVAGANRISIFGLGYLMACFYLLLFGTAMLRWSLRARLILWDCLILYNVTVIIAKNMLSLLSCVFVQQMQDNFCWVIQLFSLACTVKGYYDPKDAAKNQDCVLPVEEAGIIWDSICFVFLLLQRRVFLSGYFLHVWADLKASALQASSLYCPLFLSLTCRVALLCTCLEALLSFCHFSCMSLFSEEPWPSHVGLLRMRVGWRRALTNFSLGLLVLHSGDYFLFETDSEEDEESPVEDPKPPKQSAFQVRRGGRRFPPTRQERFGLGDLYSPFFQPLFCPEVLPGVTRAGLFPGKSSVLQRGLNALRFLWVLCQATVDGLTRWLRTLTKDHEHLSTVLGLERFVLTQQLDQAEEVHRGILDRLYQPLPPADNTSQDTALPGTAAVSPNSMASRQVHMGLGRGSQKARTGAALADSTGYNSRSASEEQIPAVDLPDNAGLVPSNSQELLACAKSRPRTASELLLNRCVSFEELEESEQFYCSQNRFVQLLVACYHFVAGHSDLLCYFIIILNNMVTASVISIVLPILIFLWAMLSIPRPSKSFWMTAIVYTEVMVVLKYLFQFGFFPWNSYTTMVRYEGKPFFPPRILGIEKTDNYIKYDLIQLLVLFFHRSLLLSYGLWDHEEELLPKPQLEVEESPEAAKGKEEPEPLASASPEPEIVVLEEKTEPEVKKGIRSRFRRKKEEEKKKKKQLSKSLDEQGELRSGRVTWLTLNPLRPSSSRRERTFQPACQFFQDILHSNYRAATDVYALMFLADVVDFIIIIFGFWAFGVSPAPTSRPQLSEDQVPQAFLVMLLIQFSTMVIDRALYLRKSVLGKLIFQVILVFGIHIWMFFILPAVTERRFNQNTVAQLWYFVKCIYFGLSAYQIRCGYPTRILGNFLTKKYNHLNLFLFQGFRLVPFLVELRAVMDWVWTDTTLSLSNWMCVEDIYANIFIIKCSREMEKKYPQPKGQKKKKIVKYGMGGLIILFLICIIWFPLLFMSLVRSVVGVVNHPIDVTVTLKLGGYEPLFTMSAQQQSIQPFTPQDYEQLTHEFERQPLAMQFITKYGYEDVAWARIEGSSGSLWSISPPSREQLWQELHNGSSDITLRFTWNFQRDLSKGGKTEYTSQKHTMDLSQKSLVRQNLAGMLQGTHHAPVRIPHLFPPYIRAPSGPEADPVEPLLPEDSYLDVEVQLKQQQVMPGNSSTSFLEWWMIQLVKCKAECHILPMVIFSDKVSPPSLGFLAGYGIMGLYVSIVLVIGKFVRGFFSEISHSIMFEELPCVDRILTLCSHIFLVRETGELELEEELYAKLIFLYRSPETMIKWTQERD
uniref:Piezo type mechanosensitive ion channel component 1 (Er blood group) n=1 Tax=Naja naja TaxID=35670 RepID=A0A8C6XGL7_NAJNA